MEVDAWNIKEGVGKLIGPGDYSMTETHVVAIYPAIGCSDRRLFLRRTLNMGNLLSSS